MAILRQAEFCRRINLRFRPVNRREIASLPLAMKANVGRKSAAHSAKPGGMARRQCGRPARRQPTIPKTAEYASLFRPTNPCGGYNRRVARRDRAFRDLGPRVGGA